MPVAVVSTDREAPQTYRSDSVSAHQQIDHVDVAIFKQDADLVGNATYCCEFLVDMDASVIGTLQQGRLELWPQETTCLVIAMDVVQIVLLIDQFSCPSVATHASATLNHR